MKTSKTILSLCVLLCLSFTSFGQKVTLLISTAEKPSYAKGVLIEYRSLETSKWTSLIVNQFITEYTFDQLTPGKEYIFRVRLTSDYGIGAPCQAVKATIPQTDRVYVYMRNCPEPPYAYGRSIIRNLVQATQPQPYPQNLLQPIEQQISYRSKD